MVPGRIFGSSTQSLWRKDHGRRRRRRRRRRRQFRGKTSTTQFPTFSTTYKATIDLSFGFNRIPALRLQIQVPSFRARVRKLECKQNHPIAYARNTVSDHNCVMYHLEL